MKVHLIFPKQTGEKVTFVGIIPPLGILSIATYLKQKIPEIDVKVYDFEILSKEEIENVLENIGEGIVGFSTTVSNYKNTLKIAERLKRKNKNIKIVLGSPHTTVRYKQILEKRNQIIDAVFVGDGEESFTEYARRIIKYGEKADFSGINGVFYVKNNKIVGQFIPVSQQIDLNELPDPDYHFIEKYANRYQENFKKHEIGEEFDIMLFMESQKGCAKMLRKFKLDTKTKNDRIRCTFCTRIDKGLRRITPERFWKRVKGLVRNNRTYIFDASDSFTGRLDEDDDWLKEVAEKKPKELEGKVFFRVYARPDEIDDEIAKYLKKIGVIDVFIGIESGNQELLNTVHKGSTIEENLKSVSILKKYGMKVYISFVYGLPDETKETLEDTYNHLKLLIKEGNIRKIGGRVLLPFPGSICFSQLINRLEKNNEKLAKELKNSDNPDPESLENLWIKNMTKVTMKDILDFHHKIRQLGKKHSISVNDVPHIAK